MIDTLVTQAEPDISPPPTLFLGRLKDSEKNRNTVFLCDASESPEFAICIADEDRMGQPYDVGHRILTASLADFGIERCPVGTRVELIEKSEPRI